MPSGRPPTPSDRPPDDSSRKNATRSFSNSSGQAQFTEELLKGVNERLRDRSGEIEAENRCCARTSRATKPSEILSVRSSGSRARKARDPVNRLAPRRSSKTSPPRSTPRCRGRNREPPTSTSRRVAVDTAQVRPRGSFQACSEFSRAARRGGVREVPVSGRDGTELVSVTSEGSTPPTSSTSPSPTGYRPRLRRRRIMSRMEGRLDRGPIEVTRSPSSLFTSTAAITARSPSSARCRRKRSSCTHRSRAVQFWRAGGLCVECASLHRRRSACLVSRRSSIWRD
jgi:hypothetical protein